MLVNSQLTAVILAKNEEHCIGRCVQSLALSVGKLVVIDSFSTDQTRPKVFQAWQESGRLPSDLYFVETQWLGFTKTRNESLKWVQTPWVLWIDADEWFEDDLLKALSQLDHLPADYSVFHIPRKNFFLNRHIRFGGWYPDPKARLARTADCEWRSGPRGADVHEDLYPLKGKRDHRKKRFLNGHLGHITFRDRAEQRATNERYSSLLAEGLARQLKEKGRSAPSVILLWIKPLIKFFENYVWKLGILDGIPGFWIAWGSSQSLFWRLSKTRELMKL